MLTQEEEFRVDMLLTVIATSKTKDSYPKMSAYDIEWLAKKLKEVNNEASQYSAELQKANEELATVYDKYE